jgi:thymidylate kinase
LQVSCLLPGAKDAGSSLWISLTAAGANGSAVSLARDHLRNGALQEELEAIALAAPAAITAIYPSFAYTPDGSYFEPGFTVSLADVDSAKGRAAYRRILQLAAKFEQRSVCEYRCVDTVPDASTVNTPALYTMHIVDVAGVSSATPSHDDTSIAVGAHDVGGRIAATYSVVMTPLCADSDSDPRGQGGIAFAALPPAAFQAYTSLPEAQESLQQTSWLLSCEELSTKVAGKKSELLSAIAETLEKVDQCDTAGAEDHGGHSPSASPPLLVVLEGLDGTGKTTLARGLETQYGFVAAATPPSWATQLRPVFDECGLPHLRRAFYAACNYEVAAAQLMISTSPVVLDRFAYSTVAYAVGAALGQPEALPPTNSAVWRWPADLLPRPALVVHLQLTPADRAVRVSVRASTSSTAITAEEVQLAQDSSFERAVDTALSRCCEANRDIIPSITLDASLPRAELVQRVAEALGL